MLGNFVFILFASYALGSVWHSSLDKELKILDLSQCQVQVEPVGCYADERGQRSFFKEVINGRDSASLVELLPLIQWPNFNHFLANFICECAKRAVAENRGSHIGVQFYGECWSGDKGDGLKNIVIPYDRHGKSDKCVDGDYNPFTTAKSCQVYTGKDKANFVYKITKYASEGCPVYFESKGCYNDLQDDPRPLPEYLFNERDLSISNWNGRMIDWQNWESYLTGLMCRCAKAAKKAGFLYFGIQFYGECWAGNNSTEMTRDYEGTGRECVQFPGHPPHGKVCPRDEVVKEKKQCLPVPCAGAPKANKIYMLKQGPLACFSDPCKNGGTCISNGIQHFQCICPTGYSGTDCGDV